MFCSLYDQIIFSLTTELRYTTLYGAKSRVQILTLKWAKKTTAACHPWAFSPSWYQYFLKLVITLELPSQKLVSLKSEPGQMRLFTRANSNCIWLPPSSRTASFSTSIFSVPSWNLNLRPIVDISTSTSYWTRLLADTAWGSATISVSPFSYRPLAELDAFRILHVQPSPDRSALINGMFEHTTLSKYEYDILNPYTALSYVWGDASDQRIIWVDGQPFAVTKNLHKALECLRDDNKSLSIWADAICIDQLKIPKRNSQVTQMGRIYKNKLSEL